MSITTITAQKLRAMQGKEGLIIQGCGGDLTEWVNGINDMLTEENILPDGSRMENCSAFEHNGLTCLYFPFEDVKLDMGKLALWRLRTHERFHGAWLSDYVPNQLGGFINAADTNPKPDCPLLGQDGNIFNLMAIASRTLRQNGLGDSTKEMCERITNSKSYYDALNILGEYVNITSVDEQAPSKDTDMKLTSADAQNN